MLVLVTVLVLALTLLLRVQRDNPLLVDEIPNGDLLAFANENPVSRLPTIAKKNKSTREGRIETGIAVDDVYDVLGDYFRDQCLFWFVGLPFYRMVEGDELSTESQSKRLLGRSKDREPLIGRV